MVITVVKTEIFPNFKATWSMTPADIDILATSRNGERGIMQSIRVTSRSPLRIRKWSQLSQFRSTSTEVIPIEKT